MEKDVIKMILLIDAKMIRRFSGFFLRAIFIPQDWLEFQDWDLEPSRFP